VRRDGDKRGAPDAISRVRGTAPTLSPAPASTEAREPGEPECDGPAFIAPVAGRSDRPTWSVMVPTYDCGEFLPHTLGTVLRQDRGPARMQIEVVDDHSKADPTPIVRDVAGERVGVFRQERNGGVVRNFNTCVRRARGELVHLLHGDDWVLPGFYERVEHAFAASPDVAMVVTRAVITDPSGRWIGLSNPLAVGSQTLPPDWHLKLAERNVLHCPGVVVRRSVYEKVGGFDPRVSYTTDWDMWARAASVGRVHYIDEPLVCYRMHGGSATASVVRAGGWLREVRQGIELICGRLEGDRGRTARRRAILIAACSAADMARAAASRGETRAAWVLTREALRTSLNVRVWVRVAATAVSAAARGLWQVPSLQR
jgi:GT2 family glycosyltransferase